MVLARQLARLRSHGAMLAGLTVLIGGLFKLAAFAREAFIAARFGLSPVSDAYFALQQFPLTVAAFLFGAFALAFTPAYANEKRRAGTVAWLPGLLLYGCILGALLTAIMTGCASWLLHAFAITDAPDSRLTLTILSLAFVPIVCLGVWVGTAIADGKNLLALFISGLPYLTMTVALLALYWMGALSNLSLPISLVLGFGVIGAYAIARLLASAEFRHAKARNLWEPWKLPGFSGFLRQLTASSIENLGFSGNQLLILYFVAQTATGNLAANNCAMRVGMLGFSLFSLPLAQLVQSRLCASAEHQRSEEFRKWLAMVTGMVILFGAALYALRVPITSMVYLHGKFSVSELNKVTAIVPAWIGYFLVASLNAIVARYLFTISKGSKYVRRQLLAYAAANLFRFVTWGGLAAPAIIWCSVVAEGCALMLNLRDCLTSDEVPAEEPAFAMAEKAGT